MVKRAHSIERQLGIATAAMTILLMGCSAGGDAGDARSIGTGTGGSRMPGNEAIPDIGRLSRGGAMSTQSGRGSLGGTLSTAGGASTGPGVMPSTGGSAVADGGSSSNGGASAVSNGGTVAAGGIAGSSDGTGGNNGGSDSGGRGGQITLSGGQGTTGGQTTIGGRMATGGSSMRGGAGGSTANTGGATATGGAVIAATGGSAAYHTIANWVSPAANNKNHHGRMYFISNAQKDDQGLACNACHGANFEGTSSAPACASCHDTWRNCNFCHGTAPAQVSPPRGVFDESALATLAVGRHTAHLSAGSSHAAFACNTCHTVPAANDVTHLLLYVPSSDLSTPGHHGDVAFSATAKAMTWNVAATMGSPIAARGTCVGACHSNGRGGNPAKTPYWAGGTWTTGCNNCHGSTGATRNSEHGHGFPGSTCADCHVGATATSYIATTHMNGTREFRTSPGGRASGMTLAANWSCSNVPCH